MRLDANGTTMRPDTRKGKLTIFKSEDLLHLAWTDRGTTVMEDDYIIFPVKPLCGLAPQVDAPAPPHPIAWFYTQMDVAHGCLSLFCFVRNFPRMCGFSSLPSSRQVLSHSPPACRTPHLAASNEEKIPIV